MYTFAGNPAWRENHFCVVPLAVHALTPKLSKVFAAISVGSVMSSRYYPGISSKVFH